MTAPRQRPTDRRPTAPDDARRPLRLRVQIVDGGDIIMTLNSDRTFPTREDATRRAADVLRLANHGSGRGTRSA
jgi:hypothetical protein